MIKVTCHDMGVCDYEGNLILHTRYFKSIIIAGIYTFISRFIWDYIDVEGIDEKMKDDGFSLICIIISIPILIILILLFIFDKEPYEYKCVSSHIEVQEYTECYGNLYHKKCFPRTKEYTVCDKYKKIKRK